MNLDLRRESPTIRRNWRRCPPVWCPVAVFTPLGAVLFRQTEDERTSQRESVKLACRPVPAHAPRACAFLSGPHFRHGLPKPRQRSAMISLSLRGPSEQKPMSANSGHQNPLSQDDAHIDSHFWQDQAIDFILVDEGRPPSRIERARERLLVSRLYLGLIRSICDDYGAEFAARSICDDYGAEFAARSYSLEYRTIGIYVFLRTVMCAPVRAGQIAHALKLPRVAVLRRLQEMVKFGYVERVGNAYRVTNKVNIPDLQNRLQRRVDMITETSRKLSELGSSSQQ
jgi:hypothetical protein